MKANQGTNNLPEELKPLYHELQELDKQIDTINQQRDKILAVIALLEPKYQKEPQPQIPEFLLKTKTATKDLETSLAGININFSAANRLLEKFFLICEVAHAAGKLINTGDCAQCLLDHQQSEAQLKNLKGNLSTMISNHPDYFEQVHPGTYRYIPEGFVEPEESGIPEPTFDEES